MVALKKKWPNGRVSGDNDEGSLNHVLLPNYAPFIPFSSPDLQRAKYKPRDLLNFAVKSFHSRQDIDLSIDQQTLRAKFVEVFNNHQDNYEKVFEIEQLGNFEKDMRDLLHFLDGFFFFGCLEQHTELNVGMDVVSMVDPSSNQRWESRTASSVVEGRHFIQIWLNLGRKGQVYDLETLVGNLVHEMVHAWYFYFSCTCKSCDKDLLNTTGHPSNHHGPVFLTLHRLIVTEIRRWHPELRDFLADDCPNDEVSRSAMISFQNIIDDLNAEEKKKYNRVRSIKLAPQMFVKLTNEGEVIVRPQLKHVQLNLEDEMRRKLLRKRELEKELVEYEGKIDKQRNNGKVKERSFDSRTNKGTEME